MSRDIAEDEETQVLVRTRYKYLYNILLSIMWAFKLLCSSQYETRIGFLALGSRRRLHRWDTSVRQMTVILWLAPHVPLL